MKLKGFIGPTYPMDAGSFDSQRTVNLYPYVSEMSSYTDVAKETTSKSISALRSTPGYELAYTAGGGPIRGEVVTGQDRAFVVSGNKLYEILTGGATAVGTINTNTGHITMSENGVEVIVADGVDGWLYNLSTGVFSQITDADFPATSSICFGDGYFIAVKDGTNDFYISALYDGSTWATLDFSNAVSSSDNLLACYFDRGMLLLFGTKSVEIFSNTGAAAFPFERISGGIIQTGCAAIGTVKAFANTVAWLGVDDQGRGVVWELNGYQAKRISTQAIEAAIAKAPDFSESYAYTYNEQGHVFYVLQVKGLDTTLVFDGSTGQWHERSYYNKSTNQEEQHRGACHLFFNKKNYIGDRITGAIYRQSLDLYSYNGDEMHRMRISPHYHQEKQNIPFSSFELDCEVGVGLTSGQGSDPQIMMQYSDDGGKTWSNELWRSMGKKGEYRTRVRWSRLGSSRDRVFKVRYTEPTFFQINEAYANAA